MFYKVAFSSNALGKIIYCEMKFQLKNTMLPIHHEANGRCKYGISCQGKHHSVQPCPVGLPTVTCC
jgi:hypothetical protein